METSSNIGNTPSGQKSKFVAEEIRQQAGVSLEDKTGKPIGLYGNKLNHLEKKWRGRPEPEKIARNMTSGISGRILNLFWEMKMWVYHLWKLI
jgi:hypothetical protein